ncbi:unnamed protein product (macronuclear) [Paramecium tetraurelia]|uniref:RRM domain-containing protein n=1 Tax=Paramecium tetraurelia TaxID=5888 RepID=A0BY82_PARTE|nr:uncharacterized protein GSPATT00033352001 [Paramecium tetraurelia]CAK63499.1 unnamed protein product [Paramecium tetraurelia]|eukprot:XP_001430897.1 hypothetical protein (macronuclear) [Paramecium tetraurelia strain d4-2]
MITIHGLPFDVNEEILFETFQIYGKILEITINKEYYESQSSIIEYADPISAQQIVLEQKEFKINNSILKISLPDDQTQDEFKTTYLIVNNIPSDITQEQLSIFFEQFGPVFNCKIKKQNHLNHKPQFSGFVEYKHPQTTIDLMEIYLRQPLKVNGKILIIQPFKDKTQPRASTQMIIQGFCRKLNQTELNIVGIQRLIELTWELLIVNYFNSRKLQMKNCFVKMKNDQPYIILVLPTLSDTIKFMKLADQIKGHPCFQHDFDQIPKIFHNFSIDSSLYQTFQQFYKQENGSNEQFKQRASQGYFNGNFTQFSCRYHFNSQDYYDDRILVISNLKNSVTIEQMREYLHQFGLLKSLLFRNDSDQKLKDKNKVCFALALTSYDAEVILQEHENRTQSCQLSRFNISDSPIKIQKLHYKHNEYEKILTELYEEVFRKKEVQTVVTKNTELKSKEYFKSFDQVIDELQNFQQLSLLDQKYIVQQLIYQIVANQSHLNLVDQKRISCLIINKHQKVEEIFDLYKNPVKFTLEIEEAENIIILDLHQEVIKNYQTVDAIMNNFETFYSLKDDQKINIIKFLMKQHIIKEQQVGENVASKITKEIMKKFNYKIQDLICLLEDNKEFLNVLNKID